MIKKLLLVTLAFSFAFAAQSAPAQNVNECEDSVARLLASGGFEGEKIQKFLNLQAGITLHKLAYASLRHSRSPQQFKLEREILSMLNEVKENRANDPAFNEVYEMFNHPENKLSRTALSRALPYVKDIINEQSGEESSFKRKYFNIGMADIKMLAILAEKEAQSAGGFFHHAQYIDRAYDQSILNFAKIINSSVNGQSNVSKEHMLSSMDRRLEELYKKAKRLLEDLDLPPECSALLSSCVSSDNGKAVIDDDFLSLIGATLQGAQNLNRHERLRYNDVWLYNNSKVEGTSAGNERNRARNPRSETPPQERAGTEEVDYQSPTLSDQEVVENHLIQHVLDHIPYLFSREELAADMEFTLALAQAIDNGILLKKGEKRNFHVGDKEYFLPELWNSEYRGGRFFSGANAGVSRFARWAGEAWPWGEGRIEVEVPAQVPERYHDDFITTLNDQVKDHGHQFAFEFQNKLYSAVDGKPLPRGVEAFKNHPAFLKGELNPARPIENSPLDSANIELAASEARAGNRSYIKDDKVFHISGAQADLDAEFRRARIQAASADAEVGETSGPSFPSQEAVNQLATNYPTLTLKSLTDRKRAFRDGDRVVDIYRGRALTDTEAGDTVLQARRNHGIIMQKQQLPDNSFVQENAYAVLNGADTFEMNGRSYQTHNGQAISAQEDDWILHDRRHQKLARLNSQDNPKDVVLGYYQEFPGERCEHVTVVDKKNARLEVYRTAAGSTTRVFSTPILLGSVAGDERTLFREGTSLRETNNKTGAGSYAFQAASGGGKTLNLQRMNFEGETERVPLRLESSSASASEFENNPRSSNGFVNLPEEAMNTFNRDFVKTGCPIHVLPETDDVAYRVEEGSLRLLPKNMGEFSLEGQNDKKKMRDYHFSPPGEITAEQIQIHIRDERFKNETTQKFVQALQDEKRYIMEDMGLTNDEYNELAKLAFGIIGTESSFGEGDVNLGFINVYRLKENPFGQQMVSLFKEGGLPGVMAGLTPGLPGLAPRAAASAKNYNNNSRGATQIKNVRYYLNRRGPAGEPAQRYQEINAESLKDPRNSAIATMYVLAEKLQTFESKRHSHSGITEENKMDYLYYMYLGSQAQIENGMATPHLNPKVREANAYADQLTILTK